MTAVKEQPKVQKEIPGSNLVNLKHVQWFALPAPGEEEKFGPPLFDEKSRARSWRLFKRGFLWGKYYEIENQDNLIDCVHFFSYRRLSYYNPDRTNGAVLTFHGSREKTDKRALRATPDVRFHRRLRNGNIRDLCQALSHSQASYGEVL